MAEINLWLLILCGMTGLLALLLTIRLQRLEAEPRPTLRDYMAGQWLAGYIASPTAIDMPMEEAANAAYDMADAMLRAREANHG